jgi:hypothetical protein
VTKHLSVTADVLPPDGPVAPSAPPAKGLLGPTADAGGQLQRSFQVSSPFRADRAPRRPPVPDPGPGRGQGGWATVLSASGAELLGNCTMQASSMAESAWAPFK